MKKFNLIDFNLFGGNGGGAVPVIEPDPAASYALEANSLYMIGEIEDDTTFTLAEYSGEDAALYAFIFSTGATAPSVTWPSGLTWQGGSAPVLSADKTYEVSILAGNAICNEF